MTDLQMPTAKSAAAVLRQRFQNELKLNEPLGPYTTFGIGGPADFFILATTPELFVRAYNAGKELNISCFVLGGGSNILIGDEGFRGLVIKSNLVEIMNDGDRITVGAGFGFDDLVDWAAERSLAGLAFAAGIAGSVGGAIYGNAGCYGKEIGDLVAEITLLTPSGEIKIVDANYCGFSYRNSRLKQTGDIILTVTFQLEPGHAEALHAKALEHRNHRALRHPVTDCSAGCFFKNIEDASAPHGKIAAGALLEEVGAKDETSGGAAVHGGHANIIVNAGGATADDVLSLAARLRTRVIKKFGHKLHREIIFLGPDGPQPERWED
jgi:UDP-N-acetylmuramate dehydrogenase